MVIGVQILSLRPGSVGGLEVLVRRTIRRMLPALGDDRLTVFLRPELAQEADYCAFADDPRVRFIVESPEEHYGPGYESWNLRLIDRAGLDAIFFPLHFFFPRPLPVPVMIHVPDVQYEFYPGYFSPAELAWRRERIPESVEMAQVVTTLSAFSARTIVQKLGADARKVHAVAPGGLLPEDIECAEGDRTEVSPSDTPFFIYPAADWPHKNHETLLKALALLNGRGCKIDLVLTGMFSRRSDTLKSLAADLGLSRRVHFVGCVEQAELIALYRSAVALAFPSRFEGFGIPLVEAMQLGCPVVASQAGAVVETAGDAALFCEDDPRDWADKLARVANNASVQADLIRRGYARSAHFSWDRFAVRHLELLRAIAGKTHAEAHSVA